MRKLFIISLFIANICVAQDFVLTTHVLYNAILRIEPTSFADSLNTVPAGTELLILENTSNDFWKVKFDNKIGFIKKSFCEKVDKNSESVSDNSFNAVKESTIDYCDYISKKVDEFTGEKTFKLKINDDVTFLKCIENNTTSYYLSIYIKEVGIYTGKGVILLLANGQKINKPNEEVECTYMSSSFYTKSFIKLTNSDLQLLKNNALQKYKLYVSEGGIPPYNLNYFTCLLNSQ